MQKTVLEHWQIRKPAVASHTGLVATQHHLASDVGAQVLRDGGNAVDAAVAAGLALGTVEPWMSGIGGGGYMTIYLAKEDRVRVVEFGMRAPFTSTPADYPLTDGQGASDAFNWQAVVGNVNVEGPLSIAVPGYVKGMSSALQQFGSLDWAEVIEPACQLAEWGLPIDWFSTQKITSYARSLVKNDEARRVYLADGFPPVGHIDGEIETLRLGRLAETYRRLQSAGPQDYYTGELAASMTSDLARVGSKISLQDLSAYEIRVTDPLVKEYRGATVNVPGRMTAGPSLVQALSLLEKCVVRGRSEPSADDVVAMARTLHNVYEYRLEHLGEGEGGRSPDANPEPTNTSHLCVADTNGNVVSLTQTIMSAFGSRVMLQDTGILMNNGMMWFDPRPGLPNSVAGGRHPLCNMCPALVQQADGGVFAVGACGGRKIFPAVLQLISFLLDYDMSVDEAIHHARIDVSGAHDVSIMSHAPDDVIDAVVAAFANTRVLPNGVSPNSFGLPQIVRRLADDSFDGGAFIPSPHAKVAVP
jgi:gamma-glutamyltranspeptidase/glutathione hydrolase